VHDASEEFAWYDTLSPSRAELRFNRGLSGDPVKLDQITSAHVAISQRAFLKVFFFFK